MPEQFPEMDEEEAEFLNSALGKAIAGGNVTYSPQVQEALNAASRGDFTHPIIQGVREETTILKATDGLPEDLAWI